MFLYAKILSILHMEVIIMNSNHFVRFFIALLILSFAVFTGCAKPPTEEMAKAEKAVEDAKLKEAPAYAPEQFAKADDSLKKAKEFVAAKKYKEAKQAAMETEGFAQQAVAGVEPAKTKMKTDAEKLAEDIQKIIDEAKGAVEGAAKKKAVAKVRDEAKEMIAKWETDLAAVKEKIAQKVKEAIDEMKAMKEQLAAKKDEIISNLSGAPAKK
jgi:hypothetical protein